MENKYPFERDWKCQDCGIIYCVAVDATRFDLPDNCPECGDHHGWENRETGRQVP